MEISILTPFFTKDIIIIIDKYLCCKDKYIQLNYKNQKILNDCKYESFFNICFCIKHTLPHDKKDMSTVIKLLKKNIGNKDVTTIHFNNKRQLQIAKPYFNLIGKVSHFCCDETGVFFNRR